MPDATSFAVTKPPTQAYESLAIAATHSPGATRRCAADGTIGEPIGEAERSRPLHQRTETGLPASMFPVSTAKEQELVERMKRLRVDEADIEESFVRSGGHGGQNVNKVSTCVVLVHRPSGTMVKCQQERSQALNRFHARRMLLDKIERALLGKQSEAAARIAKIRRQKRKRSKRAQEKIVAAKRERGETKALRAKVRREE